MKTIDVLVTTRQLVERSTSDLDPATLTRVPPGFSNNVLWNVGHLVVTQQILCYKLASLPMALDDSMPSLFAKGSSPGAWPQDAKIPSYEQLIQQLHANAEKLRADYDAGLFTRYQPYTTSAGVHLESIDDAIIFNNFHEGIHFGYILALRRALEGSRG